MHIRYKLPNQERHIHTPHKFLSSNTTLVHSLLKPLMPTVYSFIPTPTAFLDFQFLLAKLFLCMVNHFSFFKSLFNISSSQRGLLSPCCANSNLQSHSLPRIGHLFHSIATIKTRFSCLLAYCCAPFHLYKFHKGKDHVYSITLITLVSRIVASK